ncbi:MAG: pitrilysin family protein, partial [Thermoanaerobaculia bacterium]
MRRHLSLMAGLTHIAVGAMLSLTPALAADEQVDRSRPPALGPPPALDLPAVERHMLLNGLPVYLLEKHGVPVVQINLLIRTGSTADKVGRTGLAALTVEMLDEGAGERDALELAEAIAYLGADLSTWSGYHDSGIDLFTPLDKLDEALPLLADVVLRPSFDGEELERQRLDRLTALLQARDEPRSIASAQFDRALFGADHPYGRLADEASLRALKVEDLETFHNTYFKPGNAALIVVGDVTADAMMPKLEVAFGGWRDADLPATEVAIVDQIEGRTVYLVDKPGAAQSEIRIGRIGAARDTEDYYALVVMNTVLGGSFTSRLNSNLREDKGYTYGARSRFAFRRAPGPFLAGAAVQTEVTDKALAEFMKELEA